MIKKGHLAVGKRFLYEKKPIKILEGYFLDPTANRLANRWIWGEILPNGTIGKRQQGYGGDIEMFKPLTKVQALKIAKILAEADKRVVNICKRKIK